MGYESRLYIVEKFDIMVYDDGKRFARIISMFDMCKFPALSNVLRNKPNTDCYIYADDGNTRILEDCYGEPLTESTIESVIEVLENAVANGECYWRMYPLLSTLQTMKDCGFINDDIVVLHYGY